MNEDFRFRVVRWYKADGAPVREGEAICEIEMDNACADVPASSTGVLRQLAKEGDEFTTVHGIARIDAQM